MAKNSIVIMESEPIKKPSKMNAKDLRAITFADSSPFELVFADDQIFFAEEIVRLVPKKRLVAFGTWLGRSVVAKLFFSLNDPKLSFEKEMAGIKLLEANKIPTPKLFYNGETKDQVYILIFERLYAAHHFNDLEKVHENNNEVMQVLNAIVLELATQHVFGILQHDLHLNNFLVTENCVYTLDTAQIELLPNRLSKKMSLNNLALFLSQFGVGLEARQSCLYQHYANARGWLLNKADEIALSLEIKNWHAKRWHRFSKKIFRNCSRFESFKDWRTNGMYDRDYIGPEFMQFLQNPETVFKQAIKLKSGRSATVIKVILDNREYVIKRYNIKNIVHYLRRCFRATRACKSWRLAQKLRLMGVNTAKPVAFIEKRFFGLREKSYYITECIQGKDAYQFFIHHIDDEQKINSMIKSITTLLKSIAKCEVTHGDLKITNILVNQQEKPLLIDLDGAAEHSSLLSLRSAWRREIKRFLRNFDQLPEIKEKFVKLLK